MQKTSVGKCIMLSPKVFNPPWKHHKTSTASGNRLMSCVRWQSFDFVLRTLTTRAGYWFKCSEINLIGNIQINLWFHLKWIILGIFLYYIEEIPMRVDFVKLPQNLLKITFFTFHFVIPCPTCWTDEMSWAETTDCITHPHRKTPHIKRSIFVDFANQLLPI